LSKQAACKLSLLFLLVTAISSSLMFKPVEAAVSMSATIIIRADGTVQPAGAPIQWNAALDIFTLTSDITTSALTGIIIQKDDITLNGGGHTLQSATPGTLNGIKLTTHARVTITAISITLFNTGITLSTSCSNCHITETSLSSNNYGIYLQASHHNTISGNNIAANTWAGIWLLGSQYNDIIENSLSNHLSSNFGGIKLEQMSDYNNIVGNELTSNKYGIYVLDSRYNNIFHNNFVSNTPFQAYVTSLSSSPQPCTNSWDDGYPSGGNYWSDWSSLPDNKKGPSQNIDGADGIVDSAYTIDASNIDHYPLKNPYGVYGLTINVDTTDGGTTNPTPGTYPHATGSQVVVQAYPDSSFNFARWEMETATSTENPITVLVNRNLSLRAVFVPKIVIPVVPFGTLAVSLAMMLTLAGLAWFKRKPSS